MYNKEILIDSYLSHNKNVIDYFESMMHKLLVVNLAEPNAAEKISQFCNWKVPITDIPWENKTSAL